MKRLFPVVLFAAAMGCQTLMGKDGVSFSSSGEVAVSERMSLESQTKSRLAAMERSLNDYIQAKGKVPEKLDALVPDYLAEIPETLLGIRNHKESRHVTYYGPEVIVDGIIDGSKLDDNGGWGFAYNRDRVIIFVDCTHKSLDGTLWYDVRGVY